MSDNNGGTIMASSTAAAINSLADEIGEDIQARGFREDWDMAAELEKFGNDVINGEYPIDSESGEMFLRAAEALRTNVLGMKLMLMVSELSEALETLRDHGASGIMKGEGNFGEELADTKVRIDDTSHMLRIPIGDEQVKKVKINKSRPYKHGRKA